MALAMLYPEPEKGGRGKRSEARNRAEVAGFSGRRVQEACSVLRHSAKLGTFKLAKFDSLEGPPA
jgi:hypothetical protein